MKKIPTTQNKFALVDDDDFKELSKNKWCLSLGYALRGTRKNKVTTIYKMHRIIMKAKVGEEVDHIDGNRLNNQKNNLRVVTRSQNQMNRKLNKNNKSGYKGVMWCNRTKKWLVQIAIENHTKHLGYFDDKKIAAQAYNLGAIKYFGKFAKLNNL